MSSYDRHLPVYLLLDCSESMAGDAIEDLSRGVDAMVATLRADPYAIETTLLSLIEFSREARQVVPLTEVLSFQRPKLVIRPGTAMGAALRLVQNCIDREVVKTSASTKGDYKPLVILLTDGQPTDEWESIAREMQSKKASWSTNLIAIACGPDADTEVLRRFTPTVLLMKDMAPKTWREAMKWVTQSVQATSHSAAQTPEGEGIRLPELPPEVLERAPAVAGTRDTRPKQLFVHAWCSQDAKPYLMRFARAPQGEKYIAVKAHPLDAFEDHKGEGLPPIQTSMLEGCPDCPYCGNGSAGVCDCRAVICRPASERAEEVICPRCRQTGSFGPGGGSARPIEIDPSIG